MEQASTQVRPPRAVLAGLTLFATALLPLQSAGAQSGADVQIIRELARNAGTTAVPTTRTQQASQQSPAIRAWFERNRVSIIGTRPGPFEATPQFVTTYSGDRIYVHILDWQGKNNIVLPAITDRVIQKAWLLETGRDVRVDQAPWGLLVVVPEEQRPNSADTVVVLQVPGSIEELRPPRLVRSVPGHPFILLGDTAKIGGDIRYTPGPDWLEGWSSTRDTLRWRVLAPSAGQYRVDLTYACAPGCAGAQIQVAANENSRVVATTRQTSGVWKDWQAFERVEVPGRLRLRKGINNLTVRALRKSGTPEIIRLNSVNLTSPSIERAARAAAVRARALRTRSTWFRDAKYGLMVHWLPNTTPQSGAAKAYCDSVRDLDVDRWANMAKDVGASYFIFSLAQLQRFPMPLRAADAVLPGRTCKERDLVQDLADAFTKRGVRFFLYYHHGVGDPEWARAAGFLARDKSRFFANEAAVLSEIGSRYGDKLSGWWFDDRYPLQPFEQLYRAAKTGNSQRLIAFNSWILPKSTEFQDYWAGEMGGELHPLPSKGFFDTGSAAGLHPHVLIFVDDPWLHGGTNEKIKPPLFGDTQLIQFIQDTNAKGGPVTMNIGVYQDGTASPETLRQLRTVKKALRRE